MRDIRFRAWDGKEYLEYFVMSDGMVFRDGRAFEDYISSSGIILEQFTGLKDKNQKPIYENDVCQVWARIVVDLDKCESFLLDPMPVEYHGSRYVLIDKKNEQTFELTEYINTLEIIGNIHE